MRTYITTGVKLVGLVLVYNGLSEAPYFIRLLLGPVGDLPYDLIYMWPMLLSLVAGLILFFKPQLITKRIDCEPKEAARHQEITFLRVGLILIGVYFLMGNLGALYGVIWNQVSMIVVLPFWTSVSIVLDVFILLIPLYLIFGSERVVRWILGSEKLEGKEESAQQA